MRAKIKRTIREASRLRGASPKYVSLVDAGANETPFTILKRAKGEGKMPQAKRKKAAPRRANSTKSHKPLTRQRKGPTAEKLEKAIARFEYSDEFFDSEEAVRKHLNESDVEGDFSITYEKDDGVYIVKSTDIDEETLVKVAEVETDDEGVSAFVGLVKASETKEDEKEEEEEEEIKSSDEKEPQKKSSEDKSSKREAFLKNRKKEKEKQVKFNYWSAYSEESQVFGEILKSAMTEGIPPGMDELNYAFNIALRNTLQSDMTSEQKSEALTKAAVEFASVISKLDTMFEELLDAEDVEKHCGDQAELAQKFMESYGDFLNGDEEITSLKKTVSKSSKSKNSEPLEVNIGDAVVKAIGDAITPIAEKVEKLSSRHPTSKAMSPDDSDHEEENDADEERRKRAESDADYISKRTARGVFGV